MLISYSQGFWNQLIVNIRQVTMKMLSAIACSYGARNQIIPEFCCCSLPYTFSAVDLTSKFACTKFSLVCIDLLTQFRAGCQWHPSGFLSLSWEKKRCVYFMQDGFTVHTDNYSINVVNKVFEVDSLMRLASICCCNFLVYIS